MPLVNYDSDSSGEEEDQDQGNEEQEHGVEAAVPPSSSLPTTMRPVETSSRSEGLWHSHNGFSSSIIPSMEKLPDVASLFASKESSNKRNSNGFSASSSTHNKLPRTNLPQLRSEPDTVGGLLIPPQLRGRSNVATEDLGKFFVRRRRT